MNRNIARNIDRLSAGEFCTVYPLGSFTKDSTEVNYIETIEWLKHKLNVHKPITISVNTLTDKFDRFMELVERLPTYVDKQISVCIDDACVEVPLYKVNLPILFSTYFKDDSRAIRLLNTPNINIPNITLDDDGIDTPLIVFLNNVKLIDYKNIYKGILDKADDDYVLIPDRSEYHLIHTLDNPNTIMILELICDI